ncbi:MAG TPA: hypothetical protein VNY74_14530 [Edaphobacter sp.]|jgi:hypothetical protein|nr:hypothetical protein [Edaphobacter sp.]
MTTPRRAIYGPIAKSTYLKNKGPLVTGIDLPQLLSRILFFDEVITPLVNMGEIPFLVQTFGAEGIEELLNREILKPSSDTAGVITNVERDGKRDLPLFQFEQGLFDIADRDKHISDGLQKLQQVSGLSNKQRDTLSNLIQSKVLKPNPEYGPDLLAQIRADLKSNVDLVKSILLKKYPELLEKLGGLEISLAEVSPGVQRFTTNLTNLLQISKQQEHDMLSTTVLTVSNLNQSLANMRQYNAISLFEEGDAPLLFGKITGIIAPYNPKIEEEAFLRVVEVVGIPDLLASGRIDVDRLIKVRESNECLEFRAWLSKADQINDADLQRMLTGVRARAAAFISSPTGKVTRFVANAALGFIPHYGTATSLIEGAVDNFFLDKLLPSSGVLSFLSHSIPSVVHRG